MIRRPPRSTRTDTLFPYTTLFRSQAITARICRAFTQRYAAPRNPVILSPSLFCRLQAALPAGRAEAAPDLGADRPCRLGRLDNQARQPGDEGGIGPCRRSEEQTSELQSLMRISYTVFCLQQNTTYH